MNREDYNSGFLPVPWVDVGEEDYQTSNQPDDISYAWSRKGAGSSFVCSVCHTSVVGSGYHVRDKSGVSGLFDDPSHKPAEKGKYLVLLVDAAYVSTSAEYLLGGQYSVADLHSHPVKSLYRGISEALRSRYLASFPQQSNLLFESASDVTGVGIDENRERFHALVDKKLSNEISDGERAELNRLEVALAELEENDPEERALRNEWSSRLDAAISALRDVNGKLELLLASGK